MMYEDILEIAIVIRIVKIVGKSMEDVLNLNSGSISMLETSEKIDDEFAVPTAFVEDRVRWWYGCPDGFNCLSTG